VDETLLQESTHRVTGKVSEEMRRREAQRTTEELDSADLRPPMRIPRHEFHPMLVPYASSHAIFFYLFAAPRGDRQVS
jgi:hypothetical protein